MMHKIFTGFLCLSSLFSCGLHGVVLTVNSNLDTQVATGGSGVGNTGDLRYVLNLVNQTPNTYQVAFNLAAGNETITLQGMLPVLNQNAANNLVIDGSNTLGSGNKVTINGNGTQRGFFAQQGPINIQNMTIQNTLASGGNGGVGGGGGGLGAGGALFINQAQVVLTNVNMANNVARGGNGEVLNGATAGGGGMGGNGGSLNKSGGGGLGGNGGSDPLGANPAGGGGIAPGGNGGTLGAAGQAGGAFGSAAAGNAADGTLGGVRGGGGGSGTGAAFNGGGGGIAGTNGTLATGGNGGFGGGGAGHFGDGGFGGGGGSRGDGGFGGGGGTDGNGGFGGGGGGSATTPGTGGIGAGDGGLNGGGGGGLGAGGAIFVNSSNAYGGGGGTLTIAGSGNVQFNNAIAGLGATTLAEDGAEAGDAIFATSGQPLIFNQALNQTLTVLGSIGDDSLSTLPGDGYTPGNGAGAPIVKQGAGTLALLGDNTFSGGITLEGGLTQIDRSGSLGKSNVIVDAPSTIETLNSLDSFQPIQLNNTLTFDTDGNLVNWRGRISGAGSITKIDSGRINLHDLASTGQINVITGELDVINHDSRIIQNNFTVNAGANLGLQQDLLTFGDYTGIFTGNGFLEINKESDGRVRLSGNSSLFSGTTNVLRGVLDLQGSLGGPIVVFGPALLTGQGTALGDVDVRSGGRISAGLGTFTINGNLTLRPNSTYLVFVNKTNNSLLDIKQTATIEPDANLEIQLLECPLLNTKQLILTADGGLEGEFTNVTVINDVTLLVTPEYESNNIFLTYEKDFLGIAETPNQELIAAQLKSLGTNLPKELQQIIQETCPLDPFEIRRLLDQLSGVQFTNAGIIAEIANRQFTRRIFDPLRPLIAANPCAPYVYCTYKPTFDFWASATGGAAFFHRDCNSTGFRLNDFAFTFGTQYQVCRQWTIGGAIAFERDHISYKVGGSSKNNATLLGIYTLYRPKRFYVFADINFNHHNIRNKRAIDIGSLHFTPRSTTRVNQACGYIELGIDVGLYAVLLQPFFAFETGGLRFNNFRENSLNPLDLRVRGKTISSSSTRLGVHLTSAPLLNGLQMSLDLSWNYQLSAHRMVLSEHFLEFGNAFTVKGFSLSRNSFEVNAFFSQELNKCWTLYFEGNAVGWQEAFNFAFTGGVIFTW